MGSWLKANSHLVSKLVGSSEGDTTTGLSMLGESRPQFAKQDLEIGLQQTLAVHLAAEHAFEGQTNLCNPIVRSIIQNLGQQTHPSGGRLMRTRHTPTVQDHELGLWLQA